MATTDIEMRGFDKGRTARDTQATGLHHVHIQLSGRPDREWVELFEEQRRFPRHSMWRKARIAGEHIVIVCALEELERYHLSDLRQDVEQTNAKRAKLEASRAVQRDHRAAAEQAERDHVARVLDGLGDPFGRP